MVFDNVKDAEVKIEVLKLKPAPVSRSKKSFREQLHEEVNKPLTIAHHNTIVDIEKFPAEGSSIRLIYDLIMSGAHTGKIEAEVLKKFPNAPHRANFIDDYREKLSKAGKFNGVVKQRVDFLATLLPVEKPKKVLFVAKKSIDTAQDNQPKKFVKIGLKKA